MMGKCALLWFGCGTETQGRVLISVISAQEWRHWSPTWSLLWALSSTKKGPPSHIWKAKVVHSRSVTKPKLIPFRLLNLFSALLVQGLCTQASLALGKYSNFITSYCSQVKKARWERHNNMFLSPLSPGSEHFASTYGLQNKPLTSTLSVFVPSPSPQVLSAH